MSQMSRETASEIVVDYLKKRKNTVKIDVAMIEEQSDGFMVRGTCPIDLEGHHWAERFAIVVDMKGKIKKTDCGLL